MRLHAFILAAAAAIAAPMAAAHTTQICLGLNPSGEVEARAFHWHGNGGYTWARVELKKLDANNVPIPGAVQTLQFTLEDHTSRVNTLTGDTGFSTGGFGYNTQTSGNSGANGYSQYTCVNTQGGYRDYDDSFYGPVDFSCNEGESFQVRAYSSPSYYLSMGAGPIFPCPAGGLSAAGAVPADYKTECDGSDYNGFPTSETGNGDATPGDSCDSVSISHADEPHVATCGAAFEFTRNWNIEETDCDAGHTPEDFSGPQKITVEDTQAPTLTLPADAHLNCGDSTDPANTGSATATDACEGAVATTYTDSSDGGDVCQGSGEHIQRTWTATDGCGHSASGVQNIFITAGAPAVQDPADGVCMWPPNHKFHCVDASTFVTGSGGCGALTVAFHSCSSSQPANANGDGNFKPDCFEEAGQLCFRAERQGGDPAGRTYTANYVATDACNVPTTFSRTVFVPHDADDVTDIDSCVAGNFKLDNQNGNASSKGKGKPNKLENEDGTAASVTRTKDESAADANASAITVAGMGVGFAMAVGAALVVFAARSAVARVRTTTSKVETTPVVAFRAEEAA